jgi:alpha-1,2-mannosyltransferase
VELSVARKRKSFWRFSPQELCVIGVSVLSIHVWKALQLFSPGEVDFAIFYATCLRWRAGQSMYLTGGALNLNFNPPHFYALVVPFTYLPERIAFLLWTACSVLLALAIARIALRTIVRDWTTHDRWLLAACLLNAAGVQASLRLGQMSWWLALVVTLAWRSARARQWLSAGLWTGLAISLKPFLLLLVPVLAIRQRWLALSTAFISAALFIALGGLLFGWPSLMEWATVLRTTPEAGYFRHFLNASLVGIVVKAGWPIAVGTVAACFVAAATIWRARTADEDLMWTLVLVGALLCSPLGWPYYLPCVIGPLLALAASGRLPARAWWLSVAFAFPVFSGNLFTEPNWLGFTLGSIYAWGLLGLWGVLMLAPDRTGASMLEPHADSPRHP